MPDAVMVASPLPKKARKSGGETSRPWWVAPDETWRGMRIPVGMSQVRWQQLLKHRLLQARKAHCRWAARAIARWAITEWRKNKHGQRLKDIIDFVSEPNNRELRQHLGVYGVHPKLIRVAMAIAQDIVEKKFAEGNVTRRRV